MSVKTKKIIIIVISVIAILAGLCILSGILDLDALNTGSDKNDEELVFVFESQGIDNIKSVKFLKSANNGYKNYNYYDVVTSNGKKYIVEATGSSFNTVINSKMSYSNAFNRKTILNDMIEYRSSDAGTYSDKMDSLLGY